MGSILQEPDPVPSGEDKKVATKFAHLLIEQPHTAKMITSPNTAKESLQNQQPAPPASHVLLGRTTARCPQLETERSAVILHNCKIHCCLNLHFFAVHNVEYLFTEFLWEAEFSTISKNGSYEVRSKQSWRALCFHCNLGKSTDWERRNPNFFKKASSL